jgi:hypothetical protein
LREFVIPGSEVTVIAFVEEPGDEPTRDALVRCGASRVIEGDEVCRRIFAFQAWINRSID